MSAKRAGKSDGPENENDDSLKKMCSYVAAGLAVTKFSRRQIRRCLPDGRDLPRRSRRIVGHNYPPANRQPMPLNETRCDTSTCLQSKMKRATASSCVRACCSERRIVLVELPALSCSSQAAIQQRLAPADICTFTLLQPSRWRAVSLTVQPLGARRGHVQRWLAAWLDSVWKPICNVQFSLFSFFEAAREPN